MMNFMFISDCIPVKDALASLILENAPLCLSFRSTFRGTVKIPEVTGAIQGFNSQLLRYNDGTEIPMHETLIEGWNFTSYLLHYKDGT
ncbi:hypothetical protein EPI10_032771 [Gossypium australe]|uniref:Uncharacterized protein n=1 Tax=Gossypium australe TaxID=47621 RepID=A0A5B6X4I7_9ROSI|nr:hypothetical protein EPI10_032771 [Gossypium australe]